MPHFPQTNIVIITVLSNYIVTAGHWPHCNTSQNCVSKCTRFASQHIFISNISVELRGGGGGGMPVDNPRIILGNIVVPREIDQFIE